jgi:hypothetical protein
VMVTASAAATASTRGNRRDNSDLHRGMRIRWNVRG